jgi:proteasome assembly chaperone (PAC2) family protein
MDSWRVTIHKRPPLHEAILIEGLPGIGNVGKVVADFLIEHAKAKKIASFFSQTLPNSVFVGEDNLVELPKIELYHASIKGQDYLFLTGDVQPSDEMASYVFTEELLKRAKKDWMVKAIITLGGIGLQEAPQEPQVYCTGNDKKYLATFTKHGANNELYGVVGPIIGVTGLLLGLSKEERIPAVALLAETLGHPMYLGLRGAKATLKLLKHVYSFPYPLDEIDEEIDALESENEEERRHHPKLGRLKHYRDTNYIG